MSYSKFSRLTPNKVDWTRLWRNSPLWGLTLLLTPGCPVTTQYCGLPKRRCSNKRGLPKAAPKGAGKLIKEK